MLKFHWKTKFKETEIGETPRNLEVFKIGARGERGEYFKGLPNFSPNV